MQFIITEIDNVRRRIDLRMSYSALSYVILTLSSIMRSEVLSGAWRSALVGFLTIKSKQCKMIVQTIVNKNMFRCTALHSKLDNDIAINGWEYNTGDKKNRKDVPYSSTDFPSVYLVFATLFFCCNKASEVLDAMGLFLIVTGESKWEDTNWGPRRSKTHIKYFNLRAAHSALYCVLPLSRATSPE